jgi:hypothetical protein
VSTFYDDTHCGSCDVDCGSGNVCQAGHCVPVSTIELATGLSVPNGIALDAQYVYWTDTGSNTIMRVAKSGGAPELIADTQYKPMHVVVDDTYAYWTNSLGGAVMKAPKGGGGVPSIVSAADHPNEIALDDQTLYFTIEGGSNPGVALVPTSGGTATIILPAYFLFAPRSLTLDASYVYAATYRGVSRVPKGGGNVDGFGTSTYNDGPGAIGVDDSYVYTTDQAGPITPFSGTHRHVKTMVQAPFNEVSELMGAPMRLDGGFIYEVDPYTVTGLAKVPKCGGPIVTVRPGPANDIVLDSQRIYWTAPGLIGAALK